MTLSGSQLFSDEESHWFCLKTQSKREQVAAGAVRQLPGVEVLAPRVRFRKITRRGPVWFTEAVFPNYIFARFHFARQYRQVQSAAGVARIVSFGESVGVLEPGAIGRIRAAAGEEEVIVFSPDVQVGESVLLAEGPFSGLEAVVTQLLPAKERVKVLLEFLGREIEAEVARPLVFPTGSPRQSFSGSP